MVFRACIDESLQEYDILGEFAEQKRRWGAVRRFGYDLFIGRRSSKNRLLFTKNVWPPGDISENHFLSATVNAMGSKWRRLAKRPVTLVMARIERALLHKAEPLRYPPIFILGVPRSGTTLLYQLLVHCFKLSYFCNAADQHSRYLMTMTRMLRYRIRKYESDFRSNYGQTRGLSGPSEGLDIWRRWLPDHYVDEHYLSAAAVDAIRRTVEAVSAVIGAPFINKDPHHCVRVRVLDLLFPGCLFAFIQRDPLVTAESMLNIRRKRAVGGKDLNTWNSVKPKEYARISGVGSISQICGQVYYCTRNALDDLLTVAPARHLIVSYEALCARPAREMNRIAEFLQANRVPLRQRNGPPEQFDPPTRVPIAESDRQALRAELLQLYADSSFSELNTQCT